MVPQLSFEGNIEIYIPTKKDWNQNSVIHENEITIFTDGSKTPEGTGAGIFSGRLEIEESYRLKNDCSILQAEILAIEKAARLLDMRGERPEKVTIYSDNQAALKTLAAKTIRSRTVMSCREALSWIRNDKVSLCWVPGHCKVQRNIKADKLAKIGANKCKAEAARHSMLPIEPIKVAYNLSQP